MSDRFCQCRAFLRRRLASIICLTLLVAPLSPIVGPSPAGAQTAGDSVQALAQPAISDLQSVFETVSKGHVPDGYPTSADGSSVPNSLLKAVAWTESKWRQFDSAHHPLISADGGYGMMQVTTGMSDGSLPQVTQSAIANNVLYNVDYGAQLLIDKLKLTPKIGNGDPGVIEHWYYALWAYNAWGWTNNPSNTRFTRAGTPDTNPSAFPYQERVLYYLAHPPLAQDNSPLWSPIAVELPDSAAIGTHPGALPEPVHPHADIPDAFPELTLASERNARFIADVTIPDKSVLQPGQRFRKTWKMQNTGTQTWDAGYRLEPVSGDSLVAAGSVALDVTPSLASVDVSADLVAPTQPGTYRELWQMVGSDNVAFGVKVWVSIVVAAGSGNGSAATTGVGTAQGSPSATSVAPVQGIGSPTPSVALVSSATPSYGSSLSRASYVQPARLAADTGDASTYAGDVNVPDGTVFAPGAHFVKTWRIKNVGTTTWSSGYTWRFQAGTMMSASTFVAVPVTAPGSSALISVSMTAPSATGVYTSFWQMANATGKSFPHQAWVRIAVKGGTAQRPTPTSPPTATTKPTALRQSTATPRATAAKQPTSTPLPDSGAQPTQTIVGGNGQLVASPWIGALTYRTYFAAGSTASGAQESIAFYCPGADDVHVRVAFFRPDSAQRVLQFTLAGGARRTIALSQVVPGTGIAVAVEADRRVVVERYSTTRSGMMGNPGAARTAKNWFFPAIPAGSPAIEELVLFNPHDTPSTVHAHLAVVAGTCCTSDLTFSVPPQSQYVYRLGTSASVRGPLVLRSSEVVAAERLAISSDFTAVVEVPGATDLSVHWYLTDVRGGSAGMIALFNPNAVAVLATVRTGLSYGSGPWVQRSIPARSEIRLPLRTVASVSSASVEVDSTSPILVASEWTAAPNVPAVSVGASTRATAWALVGGLAGSRTSDTLVVFNSSTSASKVTIQVKGSQGAGTSWSVTVPAHGRYSHVLTTAIPSGGAAVTVISAQAVTVSHTFANESGAAVSPAATLGGS